MPKKTTPSNCKLETCSYNRIPPPENSQECVACYGNLVEGWRPTDNPTTAITLHFKDGATLKFELEKPIPQREVMPFMGEFLAKTGNTIKLDLG